MYTQTHNLRGTALYRLTVFLLTFCLGIDPLILAAPASARQRMAFPEPTAMVRPSAAYLPAVMRGLKLDPENPFRFNFIVDTGDSDFDAEALEEESGRLIRYFLAALTVPEQDLWVNLAPREERRVIAPELGSTLLGRDMLAQDYLLKQFASSLLYPEGELGQRFWERVYRKAQQQFGTTDIPLSSFNKVWIVPAEAKVFEREDGAYVIGTRLKVMLEDEYARSSDLVDAPVASPESNGITNELVKEILIPEIEREVNEGEHFARLRQIYHSLILATWYKRTLKNSILTRQYADQNKVSGVDEVEAGITDEIYQRYMQAVRKGVYNYIKEDYDPATRETVPRKYMSGGMQIVPEIDQATMAEMMAYLRSTKAREWRWKNVRTELRRPKGWEARVFKSGKEGYPISQQPDLTLAPEEIDKLGSARGTVRAMDAEEQRRLRDLLVEADNLYQSSPDMDYYQDPRLDRRDYSRRGERTVVFSQIGSLFIMDRAYFLGLSDRVRKELGPNVIVLDGLNDLQMYDRRYAMYTNAAIAMILEQKDWSGKQVIDVGAGEGILGLIAVKLGADFVEVFDSDIPKLETAKNQFRLNGMAAGDQFRVHAGDLRVTEFVEDRIEQINQRLAVQSGNPDVTVISNIGLWPVVRFSGREPQYHITNETAFNLAAQIPGVSAIIASGYNVTRIRDYNRAIKRDMRRLEELGFRLQRRPVNYHQTDLKVAYTAVRPDAAIFGKPGRLQDWLRRSRGEQRKRGAQPAWGRAKDLNPRQAEALMDRFRADPKLITLRWDGELSPGQPYGQFDYNGQAWVRENAYIRQVNGPGDLVVIRLGHLLLVDRSFYLELDDAVKEELGTNVAVIPRLNDSSLNSTLFQLYNSSTALAMIAQGGYDGHHVIDVGSGDGILALIAHKLGAKYSELIEADMYSLMRASHVLILNGMDPDTDFSVHLGDITDKDFVRKETAFMISNMEQRGADYLTVVANIGQWEDYYGEVSNRTVIGMLTGLPPVDRLILGGYDVSSVSRNAQVVRPDRDLLSARGRQISEMQLRFAGNPMTVAMVATPVDRAIMAQIEADLQAGLKLDQERVERGRLTVNGRDIEITQYRNRQFEEVPYFRVGDFIVINSGIADYLSEPQRAQLQTHPGVIFLDQEEFTDAFAYERWEGYGGFTLGVIATMQAFREQIAGRTFVDFGAGSGVLSIIASRLGAREVIAIEGRDDAQPILSRNLAANGVGNVRQVNQMIESIDALTLSEKPVLALNLPYFGLLLGSGERAATLVKALELVPAPSVAIISGGSFGRGSIDDAVIRVLEQRGAVEVIESVLVKQQVTEPDLAVSNVFAGIFDEDILQVSGDEAMFSKNGRRRLLERMVGLVDRYMDRIPPQFTAPSEPVVSLTQNNPYFHDFLQSLDIDVTIPPRMQKSGFWRYELDLDQPQRRRIMDLLAKPNRVPDRDMPDKWVVVFYKGEPLLLVMEGVRWESFSEDLRNNMLDQHASYLFRKGITQTGMRMYIDGVPKLKWSRAISLIPVNPERVSLSDRMHLTLLEKWVNATGDGPVIMADTLFDLTPIPGVSSQMVTSWGSYDARSMESTIFRVGIHPSPGEMIYLLGTGMGADAVYTAERTGGDIRIIATDIDPYLLGNARSNIAASPYAQSIRLVKSDLFDFVQEDTEKADRILFNIPIDSQITGRSRDARTSDPGMKLLKRLLTEAADHLKDGGTLEVNYMTRPSFFEQVYSAGWEISDISGQDIFNQLENARLQPFQYLRFVLRRQDPENAEQNARALSDLRALAQLERPLMAALVAEESGSQGRGRGSLSQRKRDEIRRGARSVLQDWVEQEGLTPFVVRKAADGIAWMAQSTHRLGARFKHPDRLAEPSFTLEPNPLSIWERIEDMSMLAVDAASVDTGQAAQGLAEHVRAQLGGDLAILVESRQGGPDPWEEGSVVRMKVDGVEGVIKGLPFVKVGPKAKAPGYVIELRGLPWKPGQSSTRIVSQELAHRFFELIQTKKPTEAEAALTAALAANAETIAGQNMAQAAKTIAVPVGKLRGHLKSYPGLIGKFGIKYNPPGSDQAQLATSVYAWSIREEVRRRWTEARKAGDSLHAPEVAEAILAGYALTPGQLLPKKDREPATGLAAALGDKLLALSLPERVTILEIQDRLNTAAEQMLRPRKSVPYPEQVDYQYIGELFTARRGKLTRQDIAKGSGVAWSTVKKIEEWQAREGEQRYTAGTSINLGSLLKLLNYHGLRIEELFGRGAPAEPFAPYTVEYISPNIKFHRERQNLTVDDMAGRLGMNRANYDRLEGGGYTPSFAVLVNVARALGVSLDALLRPNLVLDHVPLAVPDEEQWTHVRARYSQETVRLRLRNLRARRGLSVQQVADALGRPASYVGLMENARDKTYFIERVKRMADFYGVSLFYLVTGLRTATEGTAGDGAEIRSDWLRENIKTVREHRGLQRRDVDRLAGIPLDVVQRVEREGEPLFDYFVKISAALQVPMDLLLGDPQRVSEFLQSHSDVAAVAPSPVSRSGKGSDAALLSDAPGGIDFRLEQLNLDIERSGTEPVEFNLEDPRAVQIDGLVPVIINITPVTSIPLLLGLKDPATTPLAERPVPEVPASDPRERMITALNAV